MAKPEIPDTLPTRREFPDVPDPIWVPEPLHAPSIPVVIPQKPAVPVRR